MGGRVRIPLVSTPRCVRPARFRRRALATATCLVVSACGGLAYDEGPPGAFGPPDSSDSDPDAGVDAGADRAVDLDVAAPADASDGTDSERDAPIDSTADASGRDSGVEAGGLGYWCSGASPSFAYDVTPVLTPCTGEICHGGQIGFGDGGPPLPWPYDALVNVKATRDTCSGAGVLVKPGSVDESYLIHKLTGLQMCPNTSRMPLGGDYLPASHMQTIVDWICQGAKND